MTDAPYLAHGLTLSLAWFAFVNAAVSLLAALAGKLLVRSERVGAPRWWLLLRLAPALASILFVVLLFIPSYWRYEPRDVEAFDPTLTAIAGLALMLVSASAARGFGAWRSASRRVGRWIQHARAGGPAAVTSGTPIYVVDSEQPLIALSGIRRHRLVVTRGLVNALTSAELEAAIAHELGHRRAWDNLKRLAMRSAPDFLAATRIARVLERRWAAAAEHIADRAAGSAPSARCALASALVKMARLTPAAVGARPVVAEPISTLIGGGEIASRVQRLLDEPRPEGSPGARTVSILACAAAAAMLAAAYAPLLHSVHDTTERLIRILP